jgi:hypothetical protein
LASSPQAGEEKKKKYQFSYASFRLAGTLGRDKLHFFNILTLSLLHSDNGLRIAQWKAPEPASGHTVALEPAARVDIPYPKMWRIASGTRQKESARW